MNIISKIINRIQEARKQRVVNFVLRTIQSGGWMVNDSKRDYRRNSDGTIYYSNRKIAYVEDHVDFDNYLLYNASGDKVGRYDSELLDYLDFGTYEDNYIEQQDSNGSWKWVNVPTLVRKGDLMKYTKSYEYGSYFYIEAVNHDLHDLTDTEIRIKLDTYNNPRTTDFSRAIMERDYPLLFNGYSARQSA